MLLDLFSIRLDHGANFDTKPIQPRWEIKRNVFIADKLPSDALLAGLASDGNIIRAHVAM
jgi:hypothetical protein